MKTYNYKWIEFLSHNNVLKITNEKEFEQFKNFLTLCGLQEILQEYTTFESWQHLARINNRSEDIFLFEYDNFRGLTWDDDIKNAIDYYDKNPLEVSDFNDFFENKNTDITIENKRKKLCDLVEIEENNAECIILKIKDNSKLDLIKLGCFEGDETLIRVSKGRDNTFTIFSGDKHFSWYHGESGYTLVSKDVDEKRKLILDCIEIDFDVYIGKNKNLVMKSLDIHSLKDTYNRTNNIEIMYWEGNRNSNIIVHKNGEFFRSFNGINDAMNRLESSSYILNKTNEYVAQTGCIVEEYSMKKKDLKNEKTHTLDSKNNTDFDYDY